MENSLASCRKSLSCPNQTHQPSLHTHSFIIRQLTRNCLLISGRAVSRPKDIAEHFNDYFTSISKELQKHIPPTKRNFSDNLKNPNAESFFMTPTTPKEISDLIQTISWSKSTGPSSTLLNHFLEQHKVFYALQFGFCLNTSTNNALMAMTENIQNKNELTARVFIDLRRAFDTADHDILLAKLDHYGIRGLSHDWSCSYLERRQQFVSIGNQASTIEQIVSGVPLRICSRSIIIAHLHQWSPLRPKILRGISLCRWYQRNSLRQFTGNISKENELWFKKILNMAQNK